LLLQSTDHRILTTDHGETDLKILVTGAAGFIGYHVSKRLCERGDDVLGIDNLNDYYDVSLKEARLRELASFVSTDHRPLTTDH